MSTILLRLAGPLQSWGIDSKFDVRKTERIPTKSGVVGLVASALGRSRQEDIADVASLRFGVRMDKAGTVIRDFHTAKSEKDAYVTERYYLADAIFLVGLEGDDMLLGKIDAALHRPAFPLFLGRRSCPPAEEVDLGIRQGMSLEDALAGEGWLGRSGDSPFKLRCIVESKGSEGYLVRDFPITFAPEHRMYAYRHVHEYKVAGKGSEVVPDVTEQDAFAHLEE